jgi:hypothetical protein
MDQVAVTRYTQTVGANSETDTHTYSPFPLRQGAYWEGD